MTTAPASRPSPADLAARAAARKLIEPGIRPADAEPFRQLYERALLGSSLLPHARLVALVLAAHGDPTTGVIPEDRQPRLLGLQKETRLHPGHLVVALNALQSRGWLRKVRPGRERWDTASVQPAVPTPIMTRLLKS